MAQLTTGLIENTPVSGVRPTSNLAVRVANDDTSTITVEIAGFFVSGTTKAQYVAELLGIPAGNVVSRNYFAQFDAFEFQFATSSDAVEISVWGKNSQGALTTAQRIVPAELNPF